MSDYIMHATRKPDADYIMHHGVKGQKHGHRRYQEKDGSLTALGYIHYYGHGPINDIAKKAESSVSDKTKQLKKSLTNLTTKKHGSTSEGLGRKHTYSGGSNTVGAPIGYAGGGYRELTDEEKAARARLRELEKQGYDPNEIRRRQELLENGVITPQEALDTSRPINDIAKEKEEQKHNRHGLSSRKKTYSSGEGEALYRREKSGSDQVGDGMPKPASNSHKPKDDPIGPKRSTVTNNASESGKAGAQGGGNVTYVNGKKKYLFRKKPSAKYTAQTESEKKREKQFGKSRR